MTDLADLDVMDATTPPMLAPAGRRPHRHTWTTYTAESGTFATCHHCGAVRDDVAYRRGKAARRLGGDTERRIERIYGPRKIGERGDPVDHIGRVWRWQSKASRALPPAWLAAITAPTPLEKLPAAIAVPYWAMAGHYAERVAVVIRSYVRHGARTRDWLFVHHADAANELGLPVVPPPFGWYCVPGDWFLDHFGRDE